MHPYIQLAVHDAAVMSMASMNPTVWSAGRWRVDLTCAAAFLIRPPIIYLGTLSSYLLTLLFAVVYNSVSTILVDFHVIRYSHDVFLTCRYNKVFLGFENGIPEAWSVFSLRRKREGKTGRSEI